ncbi:MAG: ATP-binding protein [Planctomycetota bacterium]|nr:ATP-binding protein [Planctomycetota bacterium]
MPGTIRQLVKLFRSITSNDFVAAKAAAAEICESVERKGQRTAARSLRGALIATNNDHPATPISGLDKPNSTSFIKTGLISLAPDRPLDEVTLTPKVRTELNSVVEEWRNRHKLVERKLLPRSKLLFHGPPGCGKSLTARAVAHELGLPIYLVRFDSVIGAYLGQTAIHLRQLFHFAETTPCVLLLDELDALGKQRGNPLDVGELDRIVIALMQELEHSKPLGLIVATSNLAKNLDDALWRRFDLSLLFKAPTKSQLSAFCKELADNYRIRLTREKAIRAASVRSFAEAEAVVIAEARRQALTER